MQKTEFEITLRDWQWHDFRRIYFKVPNFHSKEIGYYSYKFNKLVITADLKIPDDLLLSIWEQIFRKLDKRAEITLTH